MGDYRSIIQRTFIRGLNATVERFDQPKGSLPRLSNLSVALRGALSTIPGSQLLADFANGVRYVLDWLFYKFQDTASAGQYYGLFVGGSAVHITTPLPVITLTGVNVGGGTLIPGNNYSYDLVATSIGSTGLGRTGMLEPTLHAATVSLVLPGGMNAIRVDWTGQQDAAGYILFQGGTDNLLTPETISNIPGTTLSYTDLNHTPVAGGPFIIALDTSKVTVFHKLGTGQLAKFPYAWFDALNDLSVSVQAKLTAAGGVVGNVSPIASIIPFVNNLILVMGNGYPIFIYNGTTFTKITNTFTAQYPIWQGTVAWEIGDYVIPTVANGFYYKAIQGGTNGGVQPVWPLVVGQRVVDGQVIWENAGAVTTSPAPRGAAFAIVHAGSLWVWNTHPSTTSDNIDGPSCLRMCDLNNINSWNPINTAFLDRDDGTQGMGMASFTIAESGIAPIGSLVLFKNYSSFQVVGVFGSANFSIQRIQTDMGCIAPKTIMFVPGFGIVRLTHLGFAVFDGVRDRLISEEIRPYLFQMLTDITAMQYDTVYLNSACLASNPPLYVAACNYEAPGVNGTPGAKRIFVFDLVLRCWTVVDFPLAASGVPSNTYMGVIKQIRALLSTPLQTAYMLADGGRLYRWFGGDTQWHEDINGLNGVDISWAVTTPTVYAAPDKRIYIRSMFLHGINTTGNPITVSIFLNGESGRTHTFRETIALGGGEFQLKVDIGETVLNAYALISGSGVVRIESVEWLATDKPGNVPARLT